MNASPDANAQRQFTTLIRLRETERDQVAQSLSAARQSAEHLDLSIEQLGDERQQSANRRQQLSHGKVPVQQLQASQRYEQSLIEKIDQMTVQRRRIETKIIELQQSLVEAQQRLKTLETLRDNRAQIANRESIKQEQNQLDQWSISQHNVDRK